MSNIAIRVENLGKRYRIGAAQQRHDTLRDALMHNLRAPLHWPRRNGHANGSDTFWALKDVSFDVKRGEVVGIIGRNGAGKSTLLKILSRITDPTEGAVDMFGRVGSLLEVGTGFHPELTGRENIYLSGAILGMKRADIVRRFDEIVAFAEVEKFIDTPVKHYSSGMYVRLAFAVAAHLEPEILIVDEVLAVGDAVFQKKCLGKMGDVAKEGRTVLFVSHNMAAVQNLCRRGVVLDKGRIKWLGSQTEAITQYLNNINENVRSLAERNDRKGTGAVRVVGIEVRDIAGHSLSAASSGQDIDICLHFKVKTRFRNHRVLAALMLKTQSDVPVFQHHNRLTRDEFGELPESGVFVCRLRRLPLPPSLYRITYSIIADGEYVDGLDDAFKLTVIAGDFFGSGEVPPISHGLCFVDAQWRLVPSLPSVVVA